eukprot:TRINITY_DN2590_c0_g1_i1.p1 TRINITY_DN2590_c0_g1~~TRINITY_DN2590_c0_g1_i1.p1  ORF type:complete len:135 (+),score=17.00 TRINITY_DN2590_c0_g1_i1:25-429(+)
MEGTEGKKAVITVSVIKSFSFRVSKTLVLQNINLNITVGELKALILGKINSEGGWQPYRKINFNGLRVLQLPHGAKSNNIAAINENEPLLTDESIKLRDVKGLLDETESDLEFELSLYNQEDFEAFKKNPELKW